LTYYQKTKHQFHYATLETEAELLLKKIQERLPDAEVSLTGAMRRCCPIVEEIEIVVGHDEEVDALFDDKLLQSVQTQGDTIIAKTWLTSLPVKIHICPKANFGSKLFRYTGNTEFLNTFVKKYADISFGELGRERLVFAKAGLPVIP